MLAGLVVVAAMLWVMLPFSTPTTCSWPEPNFSNVQLQAREVKAALNIKELSDNLIGFQEQVSKALIAGNKCNDVALVDKMNLVNNAAEMVKVKVMDMFSSFQDGATKTLIDLKAAWDFAGDGKSTLTIRRVDDVCKTTETLEKQVYNFQHYECSD